METETRIKENRATDNWMRKVYLENREPGHFKAYAVIVSQSPIDGVFVTVGYWGRIGGVQKSQVKYTGKSARAALQVAWRVENQKVSKRGYQIVSEMKELRV